MLSELARSRVLVPLLVLVLSLGLSGIPAIACPDDPVSKTKPAGDTWFSDVPATHWAYGAINWMANNNILNGFGDNLFKPDAPVTREQFAKIMVVALQLKVHGTYTPSFSDVPKSAWSLPYVEAAKPYLTGWRVGAGQLDLFKPYDAAVREDMAVALVGALGLQAETPDLAVLDVFIDRAAISPNLQRHAAIAVTHGIMNGTIKPDGARAFDAQGILTRAQASVLVFNALVKAGEKVTYDDDPTKVTYLDPAIAPGPYPTASVTAKVSGDKVLISWSRIDDPRFNGYKVVLSRYNPAPVYPEDGYYRWVTDAKSTSLSLQAGQKYVGGDVGGQLQAGIKYYLSITAVYDGHTVKVPGNVVAVTLPQAAAQTPLPTNTIKALNQADGVLLAWSKIVDPRFVGYKVVLSRVNSSPVYPDDGYLVWITNADVTSTLLQTGCKYYGQNDFGGCFESGKTYHARITALFKDGARTNSNVIRVSLP